MYCGQYVRKRKGSKKCTPTLFAQSTQQISKLSLAWNSFAPLHNLYMKNYVNLNIQFFLFYFLLKANKK